MRKNHIFCWHVILQRIQRMKNLRNIDCLFYIGSILPDCKPSFVYKKHEINGTFPDVKRW